MASARRCRRRWKIIAAVAAKFGPNAPEVVECCPQGRTIFRTSPDDQLAMHLQLLLTALTAHQAAIGAGPVTDAQGLLTSWNAVYAASETSSGAKTTTQEGKAMARANLQLMLFLNLLALAEIFARQPEKLDLYMQQSLLEDEPAAPAEPPTPPAPVTALAGATV